MVKINRLGIPKDFQQAPVPKGTKDNDNFNFKFYHHTGETLTTTLCNNELTCMKWHDKCVVNMLSNYHGNDMIGEKEGAAK